MMSILVMHIGKMAAAPAGAVASAFTTSHFLAQQGSINSGRRFASNTSKTALGTLMQSARKASQLSLPLSTIVRKASSSTKEMNNKNPSLMQWYESHLHVSPVRTKMITGAFLWGIGDAVAQIVPPLLHNAPEKRKNETDTAIASKPQMPTLLSNYDWPRTGRAVFFGFAIHAPCAHVHYNFLETLTVKLGVTGGLAIPVFKAFMEQFVYWSWLSNSLYHGAMGAMQGMNLTQIYDRIADVLWETQKAQWVFWIPVQLLNFRYVPVRHQLNIVLLTSIVWTALLSAWYPPEDKDKKIEKK